MRWCYLWSYSYPTITNVNEISYLNTGDWVESCSAIVEKYDGKFELIYWNEIKKVI